MWFRVILLMAGLLAGMPALHTPRVSGSIFGKVSDSSGGVLPGVTVTVTGTGLQQPLVATTSESGTYQFPTVPIGTYTVTFELASFKKAQRPNIVIPTGFNAGVDQKLEIGQMTEEVTVSAASPVVDTKKTTTGATFTADILEKIPTARDPWQIVNMTPGVQAATTSAARLRASRSRRRSRGTSANVQWNLEGGSITDLSSNSSPVLFQLRLVRSDPGHDRRRRRLGAVARPGDQPGDQERQQRVQGPRVGDVRERRDAGTTTSPRSCSTPAPTASSRATR